MLRLDYIPTRQRAEASNGLLHALWVYYILLRRYLCCLFILNGLWKALN